MKPVLRGDFALGHLVIVAITLLGSATAVQAGVVEFADFKQAIFPGRPFIYTNEKTTSGDAVLDAIHVPVIFDFANIAGLPADLRGHQQATLTMTSSTTHPVTGSGTAAKPYRQSFDGSGTQMDRIQITRDTPAAEGTGSRTLLLEIDFTGGLVGQKNSHRAILSGDTGLGDTVTFHSDFLNFSGTTEREFDLKFAELRTIGASGAGLRKARNGFFESFIAADSGEFDSQPLPFFIPEPSSLTLAGMGMIAFLGIAFRKLYGRIKLPPAADSPALPATLLKT